MKNNNKKSQDYVNILEIKVLSTTLSRLLTGVRENIAHNRKFSIVTPNPEIILASTGNVLLKEALNSADFSVSDAIGLSQAAKYLSLDAPSNIIIRLFVVFLQGLVVGAATFFDRDWLTKDLKPIKGRVLFEKLIELANKKGWKVFFLGGLGKEAEISKEKLEINYKNLKIETFTGPKLDESFQKEAVARINRFEPQLLFVALGHPKQEIWIYKNLKSLNVGGAMAVGGTFRYIAGMSHLPPKWMANSGLEWLYRFITEPWRIKRIFNAFPIFPLRIFWFKVTGS